MIADLKPYPEYKESGLPWLGKVPGHWSVQRIKIVLRETDSRSADGLGTLLSLTRVRGLIPHKDMTDKMYSAKTLVGYKRYHTGQLVMNRMQAWSGMFGTGATDGLVSPDYAVFDVLGGHAIKFVLERLKTPDLVGQFALESKGIGSGFNRLYTDRLGSIPISLPPPAEQAAIVRFLDWANGRLERAIWAKRQVIALLNEQKQVIIASLVTGKYEVRRVQGEDGEEILHLTPRPAHLMKPSGIPWLGDIPQHWELISLRMRYSVELGKMLDAKRITGRYSIPYLRNRDVQWGRIVVDDLPVMDIPPSEIARYTVQRGDLLVCEGGQIGRCAFWDAQLPVCGFQKALHRVRSLDINRDYPRFFFYQMQLAAGRGVFSSDGNENTIAHLTCEKLRRHRFVFPPFTEQKAVADWLDGELQQFQNAISRLDREIALLREYRTRLTADVVTGKLDVREAAARLPDLSTDTAAELTAERLDEADNLDDTDVEDF